MQSGLAITDKFVRYSKVRFAGERVRYNKVPVIINGIYYSKIRPHMRTTYNPLWRAAGRINVSL